MRHKHHIIPRYEGGSDDSSNLVDLSVTQHAMWHYAEWRRKGNWKDKLAWQGLVKMVGKEEITQTLLSEAGKKGGKIGGKIAAESGHLASVASKGGKIGGKIQGRKNVESGQIYTIATSQSCSKGGKITGPIQGRKNVESGHLASIASKGGKASSKKLNSQKWKCLVTGKISTAGPLTCYQKARGIDPSKRVRVL